jgi:hypothetical protein
VCNPYQTVKARSIREAIEMVQVAVLNTGLKLVVERQYSEGELDETKKDVATEPTKTIVEWDIGQQIAAICGGGDN